jgi:hypothetical protein
VGTLVEVFAEDSAVGLNRDAVVVRGYNVGFSAATSVEEEIAKQTVIKDLYEYLRYKYPGEVVGMRRTCSKKQHSVICWASIIVGFA